MTDVSFRIVGARPEPYAASPTLAFRVRVEDATARPIQSIGLHCQIRIEPQLRRYSPQEESRLLELFGETPRWGDTLKPFFWSNVSTVVRGFSGNTETDLAVPCTYDLEVAAAKYLHALDDGEIPLSFLFSGTIFAQGEQGLEASQVSWSRDAAYRLPARVWRDVMNLYFPNSGWLRLRRETLDALGRVKAQRAIASWDEVVETLLRAAGESA